MFELDGVDQSWPPAPVLPPTEPDVLEDLGLVPIKTIEARVCTLAGHLAAGTCRWLLLLGEFDARNGWAGAGISSCAQWLSWRCGLSMPAARQHVRVSRALRDLPRVREGFSAGRLSYSKVRSIVRIATPALEGQLVDLALSLPAAHLDAIVGEYRRTKALQGRPSGRAARSTTWHWDDDGSLTVRSRLAPEEGALYLAAIEAMRRRLDGTAAEDDATDDPAGSPGPANPLDDPAGSWRDDTDDGHGDLCDDDRSAAAYRCSRTDAVVAMAAAALAGGPVDTSGSDRHEVVIHADLDQLLNHGTEAEHEHDGRRGHEHDEDDPNCACAEPASGRALVRGRCYLRDGPCIQPTTLHRLACDAAIRVMIHGQDGSPKDSRRRVRLVTQGTRRLLEARDGRRCQFTGCHHTEFRHAHHIKHWALGGETNLDNLILLCSFHHRLVHEHGYMIATLGAGRFAFQRPDGTMIAPAPDLTGDPRLHATPTDLHTAPMITEHTTTPIWAGERLDRGYIASLLFPPDPERRAS